MNFLFSRCRDVALKVAESWNLILKSKEPEAEFLYQRRERLHLKFVVVGLAGFAGIFFLIAVFWGGRELYIRWQERRLVRRAVFYIEHKDNRAASLTARYVLELKPSSLGATRIMAELAERAGDRTALEWRRRILQLEPHSVEDALALARCAVRFKDLATAERVLSEIEESRRQSAGYHAVMGMLAQAQEQDAKAESEWNEAVRLAPNERAYQLQLGTLRLHAREADRHASGVAMLTALRSDSNQRAAATRVLIAEGVARHEKAGQLREFARELQAYPEATLNDRLLFLDFLHQLRDPQFSSYLTELQKDTAKNPTDLATLFFWMSANNLNLLALDFAKSLPQQDRERWPMPMAMAETYVRLEDWDDLEEFAETAQWRKFDFFRHAYLARALRAQNEPAAAEREWATSVRLASTESESLLSLVHTASNWGWETETTNLLWALAKYPDKQNEAILTLYKYYRKTDDTRGLHRVFTRLFELDPANLNVQNNLAQISLLLDAKSEDGRRLAADLYHKEPSNPAYLTTYAYSLVLKGNAKRAVKAMSMLSEEQLRYPIVSAYYGICLAAERDGKARAFLELGKTATLLPEEKTLVDKALASLDSPPKEQ